MVRAPLAWAFLACGAILPSPAGALLITGFATDLPGSVQDDAFEIFNDGSEPVPLESLLVSDGEGSVRFPPGELPPGRRVTAAGNANAYLEAARRPADYGLDAPGSSGRLQEEEPGFLLSQTGDELLLQQAGQIVDAVRYGSSKQESSHWKGDPLYAGGGSFLRWFAREESPTGFVDSDTRDDWESAGRSLLGRTDHTSAPIEQEAEAIAYTAPDQSRQTFLDLLANTRHHLQINVYEFLDADLARRVADRSDLERDILLDEQPVGMDAEETVTRNAIIRLLESSGATVHLLGHDRYTFDHAKYVIADERFVLIQSENFVGSGMPTDPSRGNRGWGVVLDSTALAAELGRLFEADFVLDPYGARLPDASDPGDLVLPVAPSEIRGTPRLGTERDAGFRATLLVAPDETLGPDDRVLAAVRRAQSEILVEQLNLPPRWTGRTGAWPNEYLEALLDASERGVRVRILLDGHFVDADDNRTDNLDTIEYVGAQGAGRPIEARLIGDEDASVLHVKGLIVDRTGVLVGSMNWNLNSISENREVGVWLESTRFAAFFAEAFESDWALSEASPSESTVPWPGPMLLVTVIILTALSSRARRRRPPG